MQTDMKKTMYLWECGGRKTVQHQLNHRKPPENRINDRSVLHQFIFVWVFVSILATNFKLSPSLYYLFSCYLFMSAFIFRPFSPVSLFQKSIWNPFFCTLDFSIFKSTQNAVFKRSFLFLESRKLSNPTLSCGKINFPPLLKLKITVINQIYWLLATPRPDCRHESAECNAADNIKQLQRFQKGNGYRDIHESNLFLTLQFYMFF